MVSPDVVLALILMASLTIYALFGGADYGAGLWDLLASGPRRVQQRELIANAITPVWEMNHVWLILVVVLLFAGFPSAFAAITTALHIPLTALVIGIVMRGSSFVFRVYEPQGSAAQRRWGLIFAMASTFTPICLGIVIGAISSSRIDVEGGVSINGFLRPWLALFPMMVGLFALSLFAFLAAVYLTVEAGSVLLQDDFRRRALRSGGVVAVMALGTFLAARAGAPGLYAELLQPSTVWIVQGVTAVFACVTLAALWQRRYRLARVAVMLQVSSILWGWGLSQQPFIVKDRITIAAAAAAPPLLWAVITATGLGLIILIPSIWYLLRIFKGIKSDVPLH
jgi:cytochrome d ubiquinol oxidase subunit II